jgi:hypothetical protein
MSFVGKTFLSQPGWPTKDAATAASFVGLAYRRTCFPGLRADLRDALVHGLVDWCLRLCACACVLCGTRWFLHCKNTELNCS